MVNKSNSSSALSRGWRLGRLGLGLSGSYLGYQAQNLFLGETKRNERRKKFQRESSRRLRAELGSMKGAAMKLGQLLSLQTHELPEEALEELAHLQMHAPAMHPTLARAQFKSSLGKNPEEIFREFDPEPFAAASLGQVHRAMTHVGEKVAVKIQYPAIRSAIENDLKLLRSVTMPGRLTGIAIGPILDEVRRGFLEETDYVKEGRNIEHFTRELAGFDYVHLPRVFWDWTTDRILTMSFVEGESMGAYLKRKPSQQERDRAGEHLVELYQYQLHRMRALHADYHPGNFLFHPGGDIGLVDFGCVKHIQFDITDLIRGCVSRSWQKGEKEARHFLGLVLGPNAPFERAKKLLGTFEQMADILFPQKKGTSRTVNFGKAESMKMLTRAMGMTLREKVTNPEFAFISRAEMGLYSLLHQLGAHVNVSEVWSRVNR